MEISFWVALPHFTIENPDQITTGLVVAVSLALVWAVLGTIFSKET
jgi:hypothetical protein